MLTTVLRSTDVCPEERIARFDEVVGLEKIAGIHSTDPGMYQYSVRAADLAGVIVEDVTLSHGRAGQVSRIAHPRGTDLCGITTMLSGAVPVAYAGHAADLAAGEFMVHDGSHTGEIRYPARDTYPDSFHMMRAWVPQALLRLPGTGIGGLVCTGLPARHGLGGLLVQFLAGLAADPTACGPHDAVRIGTIVTDLMAAALAHYLDAPGRLPDSSRQAVLLDGIRAYIRRHLGDPDLSPRSIAVAHHISVSYLHRLFQEDGHTVAAWVRQQRLEHACRDLRDPSQAHLPVHRIAAHWGFTDHATFTRAFRRAYQLPPQAFRETALT